MNGQDAKVFQPGFNPVRMSSRGASNVAEIMPKITAAVTARSEGRLIDLASAENWLIRPELIEICKEAIVNNLKPEDLSYPRAFAGFPEILDSFAAFLNSHFNPKIQVEVSHIATAPGAASCIDALLYNVCDPGDGILVPGPYWSGFDFQFKARSSVIPVSVVTSDLDSTLLTTALIPALEHAFDSATIPIRALLICNPHNPFGQCYPRECIEECLRFCQRRNIHYISDEVYAMTTFPCHEIAEPVPFISVLSVDVAGLGCNLSRVHTVWSTSKDFGQSGVRMGCAITQGNKEIAVGAALASHTQTSTLSSICASAILASPRVSLLIAINSDRLAVAYSMVVSVLKKHRLRYIPSYAGLYLFAQIAPDCKTWEEEGRAVQRLKHEGVLVSGGRGYHGPESEKGWARIGFAIPKQQLASALEIMDKVFEAEAELRRIHSVNNKKGVCMREPETFKNLVNSVRNT
ncbi:hypothetical protein OCU04_000185 [Sclerotinia nivalis]|uniref:Aminotransferase class I/classII large domain-containing protein n=1 Tax=Sclerotinia nivalis TaxID=352851 RepID=A0A9X0DQ27_9HELO|nr:hypothetical protein OCU04_000185 [Sclerotinia nivalis]